MKFILVILGILVGVLLGGFMSEYWLQEPKVVSLDTIKEDTLVILPTIKIDVKVTSYQPTIEQCDSTPFNTASGDNITDSSYFRWCAVSKDLLYWYVDFDDTIKLWVGSFMYNLIVKDIVRGSKHIDVLVPVNAKRSGMLYGKGVIEIQK